MRGPGATPLPVRQRQRHHRVQPSVDVLELPDPPSVVRRHPGRGHGPLRRGVSGRCARSPRRPGTAATVRCRRTDDLLTRLGCPDRPLQRRRSSGRLQVRRIPHFGHFGHFKKKITIQLKVQLIKLSESAHSTLPAD